MDKKDKQPCPTALDPDYEKALTERKELLEILIQNVKGKGEIQNMTNVMCFGSVSGVAMFLDMFVLGGMATGIAMGCAFLVGKYRRQRKGLVKELESINEDLKAYQDFKERLAAEAEEQTNLKSMPSPIKDTFRKTVVPENKVDAVQRKMDSLQKKQDNADDKPKPR